MPGVRAGPGGMNGPVHLLCRGLGAKDVLGGTTERRAMDRKIMACGVLAVGGVWAMAAGQPAGTSPTPAPPPAPPVAPATTPEVKVPAQSAAKGTDVVITVDSSEAEDLTEWVEKARGICVEWYPKVCALLDSEGFEPAKTVKIVLKKKMNVPAATGGGVISVNADYVRHHTDDLGMMVHELTHVVQAYRHVEGGMGWMTEGIADYVRFYKYEPGADHSKINPKKASYRDSYRTTAAFLAFVAERHDPNVVTKLNAAMRAGGCDEAKVKEIMGAEPGALWKEFVAALETPKDRPAAK